MKIVLVLAIFAFTVYQANARCEKEKFGQCMRDELGIKCGDARKKIQERRSKAKEEINKCFENARCDAPVPAEVDGKFNDIKVCMKNAKKSIKNEVEEKLKAGGCEPPDRPCEKEHDNDDEGPFFEGGGPMAMAKGLCTAYNKCNNKNSVKNCVGGKLDRKKDEFKKNFLESCVSKGMAFWENACGGVKTCVKEQPDCRNAFKARGKKLCECWRDINMKDIVGKHMKECFEEEKSSSNGGGLLAGLGNIKKEIKKCMGNAIKDSFEHFQGEAEAVCGGTRKPCAESAGSMRRKVTSKCQEIVKKMQEAKKAAKRCLKDKIPGGGNFEEGKNILDKCQQAEGLAGILQGGGLGNLDIGKILSGGGGNGGPGGIFGGLLKGGKKK